MNDQMLVLTSKCYMADSPGDDCEGRVVDESGRWRSARIQRRKSQGVKGMLLDD